MADIPAGTGLGSSGSFTDGAAPGACMHSKQQLNQPGELAEQACHIELDLLKDPIGKQDQYIAAYGGFTCFEFMPTAVKAGPLRSAPKRCTASKRTAAVLHGLLARRVEILKDQDEGTSTDGDAWSTICTSSRSSGNDSKQALEAGDPPVRRLMHCTGSTNGNVAGMSNARSTPGTSGPRQRRVSAAR